MLIRMFTVSTLRWQKLFLVGLLCALLIPSFASAQDANVTNVADPQAGAIYERTLKGAPDDYRFNLSAKMLIGVTISVPEGAKNDVSAQIIKDGSQLASLDATLAGWDTTYTDPKTGKMYRNGSAITITLDRGTYDVRASSPKNDSQYALRFEDHLVAPVPPDQQKTSSSRTGYITLIVILLALAMGIGIRMYERRARS